jgi:hypothetical protein
MKPKSKLNIYKQAQQYADLTKRLMANGSINKAKICLQKAENFFVNGTTDLQNVVTNVYLYSVSSFMESHHFNVASLLPAKLKNEYYKQVNASGL